MLPYRVHDEVRVQFKGVNVRKKKISQQYVVRLNMTVTVQQTISELNQLALLPLSQLTTKNR